MNAAPHSIDELLTQMAELDASDLHLTAGSNAVVRVRGQLERLEGTREAHIPTHVRDLIYGILSTEQQKNLETKRQSTSPTRCPASPASASTPSSSARALGAAFRLIPTAVQSLEELGMPEHLDELAEQAARARARDRPDRLRQVDHAGGADRPDQPHPPRAHPHDRGPDRVPALAPELHRQPARGRLGRDRRSPTRCAPRCARTPT